MAENNLTEEMTDGVPTAQQLDLFVNEPVPTITGDELKAIEDVVEQQKQALESKYSYQDIAREAIDLNTIGATFLRTLGKEKLMPDPDFAPTFELFEQVAKDNGIRPEHIDAFSEAQSMEHLNQIVGRIRDVQKSQDIIMSKGIAKGLTAHILSSVLDPAAIGVAVASEGALAPLILMNKLSRMQRVVRGGLAGMSSNVAIEGYLATEDPTMDSADILFAGLLGFGIGGGVSALRRTAKGQGIIDNVQRGAIRQDIEDSPLELTEKGKTQLKHDNNQAYNDTKTIEDFDSPVDTLQGMKRSDGRNEIRVAEGEEYMRQVNEDGTVTLRRCK
tara:strand:+ start:2566 stop:3558 length:993 start_codon:yes stop_codon:yes gene_type:complete